MSDCPSGSLKSCGWKFYKFQCKYALWNCTFLWFMILLIQRFYSVFSGIMKHAAIIIYRLFIIYCIRLRKELLRKFNTHLNGVNQIFHILNQLTKNQKLSVISKFFFNNFLAPFSGKLGRSKLGDSPSNCTEFCAWILVFRWNVLRHVCLGFWRKSNKLTKVTEGKSNRNLRDFFILFLNKRFRAWKRIFCTKIKFRRGV